jgi:transcriptional regulator with XRE-family HTH domain
MGEVGKEIRRLREAKGWGQTKLAATADMAVSGVSQIENGHRNPNSATLIKLAGALGVEVADLFPKGQAPLPLEEAPSLKDLHAATGCETDWLICPEARWHTSWSAEPRPQEAMKRVRETATEFAKLRPLMAEQDGSSTPYMKRKSAGWPPASSGTKRLWTTLRRGWEDSPAITWMRFSGPADDRAKKRACDQHARSEQTLTPTKGPVEMIIQKRGGTGTRRQASPAPRNTHSPEQKIQGVCR